MVFDTATPCFNIEDENNNSEATRAMNDIRKLMAMVEPTASAIILKHAKVSADKGGPRMIRGAKAWKGAVDQQLFLVRAKGRPRKGGLQLTRLMPDKGRAYALSDTIFITPSWTDERRSGLLLEGSYQASREHKDKLRAEEGDEED